MKHWKIRLASSLFLMAAISLIGYAQGGASSSLIGVVVDQSGGVIPGAEVTVHNDATGAEFKTVTTENGTFSIPALAAGTYTATVSVPNFKQAVVKDIKVVAGNPSSIRVQLQVGGTSETVTVQANAEVVQASSATITTTLGTSQLSQLPLATRNAMDFLVLLPGVNTTSSGARSSTIAGLPQAAINITIDGVNTQDNSNKTGDGFFSMITPRLDAMEEVTVSTATPGAESAGQGAIQIRFITRSGNNEYHGSVYEYHRNPVFNSNYWFNNRDKAPTYNGTTTPCTTQQMQTEFEKCKALRDRVLLNQPGFRVGGPITLPKKLFGPLGFNGKDKAFFFVNYEEYRFPSQQTRTRTIYNPAVENGKFRYLVGTAPNQTVNEVDLLALAAANGNTSTFDPTVKKMLTDIRNSVGVQDGTTVQVTLQDQTDPLYQYYYITNKAQDVRKFYTTRGDFNLTSKHRLEMSWNYSTYRLPIDMLNSGDPSYAGFPSISGYLGDRSSASTALRSTLTPRLVNEFRFGLQAGPGLFGPGIDASMFSGSIADMGGFNWTPSGISSPIRSSSPSRRTPPLEQLDETLSWNKGSHSLSFGGSFTNAGNWTWSQSMLPSIGFGVDSTNDPARFMFDATNGPKNFPNSTSGQRSTAQSIYASLTGRVTSIGGSAILNENTLQYAYLGPNVQRMHQREIGLFLSDSWRMRPGLTLNYGVRWELQLPWVPLNSVYSWATPADVWGPSGFNSLFKQGATGGRNTEYQQFKAGDPAYNLDYRNIAPSFGFAWSPNFQNDLLSRILGNNGQSVFRGGFSVAYSRYGMATYSGVFTGNPGLSIDASRNQNLGNLVSGTGSDTWPLLFRDKSRLGAPPFLAAPVYPMQASISNNVTAFDPDIKVPYTLSWSFGLQRELTKDMAIEVRYVANRNLRPWYSYSVNTTNIVENGLLDEFKLAMANLQANIAANRGSNFKYYGPGTNTSPLPITLAYFSGIPNTQAGDTTKYTSSNFTSSSYVNTLAQTNPNPSSYASSLSSTATQRANAIAAGLPANFFIVNPTVNNASITGNGGFNMYDSMVIELRRRMAKGLMVQANYVFAKSLGSSNLGFRTPWAKVQGGTLPSAFKVNWVYEMPIGPGRALFGSAHGWTAHLIGNWEVQGTGRWQSGDLLNFGNVRLVGMTLKDLQDAVGLRFDDAKELIYYEPADIIANTIAAYNTDATQPTGYSKTYGTPTGRYVAPANTANCIQIFSGQCAPLTNYVRGLRFQRFDISLVKRIRFTESKNFELRGEFLNAFNNINFNASGGICTGSGANCGQFASAYRDPNQQNDPGGRLVQLVARINF
ncbi:MAG: carboxypeptidase-like regulatory domain-containing protein [Acidobacteriia bacterium]|nr:carboxypeptidase-like regulatory domain-containing protein [Terriglobia bacterium]